MSGPYPNATQAVEGVTALGIDPGFQRCGIGAVHRAADGQLVSAGVRYVEIKKGKGKGFEQLRVSMDDERRVHGYYDAFVSAIEAVEPKVVGVECYTVHEPVEYQYLRSSAAAFMAFLGLGGKNARPTFATPEAFLAAFRDSEIFIQFLKLLGDLKYRVDAFKYVRGRGAAAKTMLVYSAALCAAYRFGLPVFVFMPVDLKKAATGGVKASKEDVEAGLCQLIPGLEVKVAAKIPAKGQRNHVYDAVGHAYMALREYERWLQSSGLGGAR